MSEVAGIIKKASYLLDFQKDALIDELDNILAEDSKLYCKTLVDEVFRKLFNKGIEESLSANEMSMLDSAIEEFTGG